MGLSNKTGPPVEGEDFFGREKELEFAWKQILNGNSILLSAPRRVGKTSFAKKLLEEAKANGWKTLEINLEEISTEIDFVKLFVERLREQNWWETKKHKAAESISNLLSKIKPSITSGDATLSLDWTNEKVNVYEELKGLLDHNEKTLIMVDELTILLSGFINKDPKNGKLITEEFLNWLRSFRQKSQTKIRWVFCSSVGIEYFANQNGLSNTINDIDSFPLDAYTAETAFQMFEKLSESCQIQLDKETIEHAVQKLGWHLPYFIQILFSKINQLIEIHAKPGNKETVDEAYSQLLHEKHLNTWDERLKEYGHHDEKAARIILTALSQTPLGVKRDTLILHLQKSFSEMDQVDVYLSRLLYMLNIEGYLIEKNKYYSFRSPLLRDFWFNRFAK